MPHWKCRKCHHEWDVPGHVECDWCGADKREPTEAMNRAGRRELFRLTNCNDERVARAVWDAMWKARESEAKPVSCKCHRMTIQCNWPRCEAGKSEASGRAESHIHAAMLARIDALMDAKKGTPEGRELEALAAACEAYESAEDPVFAIRDA